MSAPWDDETSPRKLPLPEPGYRATAAFAFDGDVNYAKARVWAREMLSEEEHYARFPDAWDLHIDFVVKRDDGKTVVSVTWDGKHDDTFDTVEEAARHRAEWAAAFPSEVLPARSVESVSVVAWRV